MRLRVCTCLEKVGSWTRTAAKIATVAVIALGLGAAQGSAADLAPQPNGTLDATNSAATLLPQAQPV